MTHVRESRKLLQFLAKFKCHKQFDEEQFFYIEQDEEREFQQNEGQGHFR